MDTLKATDVLKRLSADELRARLAELDAEEKATRVLLRAAIARDRQTGRKGGDAMKAPKLLLPPREAADSLSICEKTLWSQTVPRGSLKSVRIGRSVRYSLAELQRWIESQENDESHAAESSDTPP